MPRARDFYLMGQRLGDLRRYAETGTDLFPTGRFPVGSDSYGTMHCFIVPLSEKADNPNYWGGRQSFSVSRQERCPRSSAAA